ncbi:D-Ala-D-Ala carboxypeptidase family metallohydrolase [bacterium]|nr:D-Ala-D-Ala carboxypeptidase family metallohydrolase [bacterium]
MGDLSENFSREEFRCNCEECDQDAVDHELINLLEDIRANFGASIKITSGNRCPEYNKAVGGKQNSQHLKSKAADIIVDGVSPHLVAIWASETNPSRYGVGMYDTFTHVDVRSNMARWGF